MRGYLLVLLILLFCSTNMIAQNGPSKYYDIQENFLKRTFMGVNAGAAIPFAAFASKDFYSATSGYAKTGYNLNVTFRYAFTDYIGITAKYFYSENQFDEQSYQNSTNNYYMPRNGNSYKFSSDPWTLKGFMFIPTYILKAQKFNIELGVGVGMVNSTLPQNQMVEKYPNDSISIYSQNTTNSSNWAFSVEAAIRYKVYKNVILSLQGDVIITDQSYQDIYTYINNASGSFYMYPPSNILQPFRLSHITAGIGFEFD